ncbi:type I-U CRISPR-associated RAMP protein Csb1/Cas7u [Methylococcus sp. EFPC2]|uniref:type I-G CRISPR-associated RAMP protein Csb1/Cas7g n=1 Tax=Methylococcus sp. EFPC2 TaxID=2812648 RepID=UPI001967CD50|nr:type I-U CRISPR-associated RAMP protein Csb1/Cas7u [Methylococcus sp. EFPC2]QSA97552.1 type I-U CRISPR-associated protein Cas7 [Methylococcus sp. EFPC2]
MHLSYSNLTALVNEALALSFLAHLESSDGSRRVAPPTYAPERKGDPSRYLITPTGEVRLDSPQSFANRLEEVIADEGLTPSFDIVDDQGEILINSRQLPHRVFDAALRDSNLDGQPFFKSTLGVRLREARPAAATDLFLHSPESLLFGVWDSHTGGGGQVLRLARAVTARIYGTGAVERPGAAQKSDPLNITKDAGDVFLDENGQLTTDPALASKDAKGKIKAKKPSDLGHGSVPASAGKDGVDVDDIVLQGALHLGVLGKYGFPGDDGQRSTERDIAVRAALAALGLWAVQTVATRKLYLRSGCDLIYRDIAWLARFGGGRVEALEFTADGPKTVLNEALKVAADLGLSWQTRPVVLSAGSGLLKVIEASQAGHGGEEDGE